MIMLNNKYLLLIFFLTFYCITNSLPGQVIPKRAFVVNTVANTLSVLDIDSQSMIIDTLSPGPNSMPNYLAIRNGKGYVIDSGINDIMVFDIGTLQEIKHIPLPNGVNPWAMDFVDDSVCVVSFYQTDQVAFLNAHTNNILNTVNVGISPEGVKYFNNKVYVANSGFINVGQPYAPGSITVLDARTFSVINSVSVSTNPQDLDIDVNGNLLVACTGDYFIADGKLEIINTLTDTVISSVNLNPDITGVRVSPENKAYLVTYGQGVLVYDLVSQTFEIDEQNPLTGGPGVAFDASSNAYITDFGNGIGAGGLRVFSPVHQQLQNYLVSVGPSFVAVSDPAFTNIAGIVEAVPNQIKLYQNYPNPFNPGTNIDFELNTPGKISLEIFNLLGQRVTTIYDGYLSAGSHRYYWDGLNVKGLPVSSGIYFYRLRSANSILNRKMYLLR
jgi:hypothetical protein